MSNKYTGPNYPIDSLVMEIERTILSLEEYDVVSFAEHPTRFLNSEFDPHDVRFLVTARLSTITDGMIEHSIDTSQKMHRRLPDKIISALINHIDEISDLSKLREECREQLVSMTITIGKHAGLKDRNIIAAYLAKISAQLNIDDCIKTVQYIKETFVEFPSGNKSGSSSAFRVIIHQLYNKNLELRFEEQENLTNSFKTILQTGEPIDISKALGCIGKYILLTPSTLNENLELILHSLTNQTQNHQNFHKIVASFSGRIAQCLQDYSDDLSDIELESYLITVEKVFEKLATHPNPEVRVNLAKELAISLDRLSDFDHKLNKSIAILSRDPHPDVKNEFARQMEYGFLQPCDSTSFER